MPPSHPKLVFRLAVAAVFAALLLVIAGGLVTSRDAGLAVPDWPLSYGTLNPPRWWAIENVRTEHGHRLVAACVALLTVAMAAAARMRPCPARVRTLATWAACLVLVQAVLGGLRVLAMSLDLAMIHGVVAQVYFVVLVLTAAASSPLAAGRPSRGRLPAAAARVLELLTVVVAGQLVLGIVIRHLGPAVRPLADNWVFYLHVTVGLAIFTFAVHLRRLAPSAPASRLRRAIGMLPLLVGGQILLGILTWLVTDDMRGDLAASVWQAWLPTLHVALGALVFAAIAALAALPAITRESAEEGIDGSAVPATGVLR
ncbi:MAG: hypothetical protein D6760_09115 [Deltaproteobacteria bacterium]|nr:MAG: hypothetical protein D6760_09115 [Deltaproteobacteria bacterium]